MIYVFEDGAVVYDGNTISEEEKQEAVAIEVLPEPEKIEGKIAVLRANKAENRVYYEYIDEPKLAEIERRILLENRITELEAALEQKAPLDVIEEFQRLQQEKSDIEQAIAELSILIAGGGE